MFCVLQRLRSIYRDTFLLQTFRKHKSPTEAASDHTYLVIVIEIACILLQVRPSPPYQSL